MLRHRNLLRLGGLSWLVALIFCLGAAGQVLAETLTINLHDNRSSGGPQDMYVHFPWQNLSYSGSLPGQLHTYGPYDVGGFTTGTIWAGTVYPDESYGSQSYSTGGGTFDFYVVSGPPPPYKLTVDVYNPSPEPRYYKITDTVGDDFGPPNLVPPGTHWQFTYTGASPTDILVTPYQYTTSGWVPTGTGAVDIPATDSHWQQTSGTPTSQYSETDNSGFAPPTSGSDTNWVKVGWPTSGTQLALDDTVKHLGDVLYNTLEGGLSQIAEAATASAAGISGVQTAVSSGFSGVNSALSGLQTSVNNLQTSVNNQSTSLATTANGITTANGKLDTVNGNLGTLNTSVGNVKTSVDSVNSSVGQVKTSVDQATAAVNSATAAINTVNGSVNAVQSAVAALNSGISSMSAAQNNMATTLSTLTSQSHADMAQMVDQAHSDALNNGLKLDNDTATLNGSLNSLLSAVNACTTAVQGFAAQNHMDLSPLLGLLQQIATATSALQTQNHIDLQAVANAAGLIQGAVEASSSFNRQDLQNLKTSTDAVTAEVGQVGAQAHTDSQNVQTAINATAQGILNFQTAAHQDAVNGQNQAHADALAIKAGTDMTTNILGGLKGDLDTTTNLLGKIENTLTNASQPDVDSQVSQGNIAKSALTGPLTDAANAVGTTDATGVGDGSGWNVPMAFGNFSWNWDLNPMDVPGIASLADKIKALVVWCVNLIFLFAILKLFEGYFRTSSLLPQARSAGTEVFGVNINSAIALVTAAAITAALVSFVVWFTNYWDSHGGSGMFGTNPFNGGDAAWARALYLLGCFLPMDLILGLLTAYVVFRWTAGAAFGAVAVVVRFIVG